VLKTMVLRGPDPKRDGRSSWTAKDLCHLVEQRFGVTYSENGMLRLLHGLELSWQKTRPIHPQADRQAQAQDKKLPGAAGRDRGGPAGSGTARDLVPR
jgi:transposase